MKVVLSVLLLLFASTLCAQSPAPHWMKTGHSSWIYSLAFSNDGRYVASMDGEKLIVWNLNDNSFKVLNKRQRRFGCAAFTPDSRYIFASADSGIYKIDLSSGDEIDSLTRVGRTYRFWLSGTSDSLLSEGDFERFARWDLKKHSLLDTVTLIQCPLTALGFGPDISVSADLNTILYHSGVMDGWTIQAIKIHQYGIDTDRWIQSSPSDQAGYARSNARLLLSPSNRRVAIITDSVRVYDLSGYWLKPTASRTDILGSLDMPLSFSEAEDTLFYCSDSIRSLDLRTGSVSVLAGIPGGTFRVVTTGGMTPDRSKTVIASSRWYYDFGLHLTFGGLLAFDTQTKRTTSLTGTESTITGADWSPVSTSLAISDAAGNSSILDQNGNAIARNYGSMLANPNFDFAADIKYGQDAKKLFLTTITFGSGDLGDFGYTEAPMVLDTSLQSGDTICAFIGELFSDYYFNVPIVSPTLKHTARDSIVEDAERCEKVGLPMQHVSGFFANDSSVVGYDSNKIVLYSLANGQVQKSARTSSNVNSATVSRYGSRLAVNYEDSTIEIRDLPSLEVIGTLPAHYYHPRMALSMDGGYLLSAAEDSAMTLWDAKAGTLISSYTYPSRLCPIGFSYDNKYIAATDSDQTIICWDAPSNLGVAQRETGTAVLHSQVSPNPFTNSTTIHFTIPSPEYVRITVYDAEGRQVAQIASGEYNEGEHDATFDANGFAPGVYFYGLSAGDASQVRAIILE